VTTVDIDLSQLQETIGSDIAGGQEFVILGPTAALCSTRIRDTF